jgi:hypothetical protein
MSGFLLLLLCAVAPLLQTGAYRRVDALPGKGRGVEKKKQQAEKRKLISQSFPFFSLSTPLSSIEATDCIEGCCLPRAL